MTDSTERIDNLAGVLGWGPPERIRYEGLVKGLRSEVDPVTWRTLVVDSRMLMGVTNPDKEKVDLLLRPELEALGEVLLAGTWLETLKPEWIHDCGITLGTQANLQALDVFVNARHLPESLLFSMARLSKLNGMETAVVNPMGHFKDRQTRIVFPELLHPVDRMVFVASTQESYGGDVQVLARVLRILRGVKIAGKVKRVEVVVPMWGGSRGHKEGQDFGFEVLEAKFDPKVLAVLQRDIYHALIEEDHIEPPRLRFFSVDIHNEPTVKHTIEDMGFEFVNVDPMRELAEGVEETLARGGLSQLPKKVIACDGGALVRAKNMVKGLFMVEPEKPYIDLVTILKERVNGDVGKVAIDKILRFYKDGTMATMGTEVLEETCVAILTDDILDTGGTACMDNFLVREVLHNLKCLIFAATHLIASQGVEDALNRVGADYFVFGNTLNHQDISDPRVLIADVAPAIIKSMI